MTQEGQKGKKMKKAMANILSALILILSVLLLLLPYLPPALAGRLVGIGYGALVIIIANILATLLRKRWWRRVHLAIVVLSLPLIWAYVPLIPKEPKPGQQSVSIVSWNVDNFLVSCDTMLHSARYMRTLQPDIICLQERPHEVKVAWTDILDALPQHRHAVRNSYEDEVLNLAILSCHPIIATGERTFKGTYNKYLWADVATKADTLRIFCVHLQTTGITPPHQSPLLQEGTGEVKRRAHKASRIVHHAIFRDEQALTLYNDIRQSPHPVVVCGDFNDTPCGYPARRLRTVLTDFSRRPPFCGTFKRWHSILKIDHMMCSRSLRPLSYQIADTPWSDHKLQIGTVGITAE